MKKQVILASCLSILAFSCKEKQEKSTALKDMAMLIEAPATEVGGWVTLFDGKSMDGWHGYNADKVPSSWKVEEGEMVLYPLEGHHGGSNLVTDKDYTDFVLSLDWKISEGGNSGIMWGVKENPEFGQPYVTGPEIQVLDDEGHPDGKNGRSHQSGALYDMIGASKDVVKPVGEWNTCVITINHKKNVGKVELNGKTVVKFPVTGEGWDKLVADSKFKNWKHFGKYPTGKIALQDHGNKVSFKNIKIKEL